MLAAALIIGYSAVNMLRKAWKMKPARAGVVAPAAPAGEPPVEAAVEQAGDAAANDDAAPEVPAGESSVAADTGKAFPKLTRKQLAIGAAIGLGAGLASGYVGVGGGFIMVPLMLSLVGISMKQASGTSLIAVMLLAIPGTIEQGLLGNIDYMAGIAVAVGSIPGAVIGARLVRLVPERTLRFIFGGVLIVAAVVLVLNEVGVL